MTDAALSRSLTNRPIRARSSIIVESARIAQIPVRTRRLGDAAGCDRGSAGACARWSRPRRRGVDGGVDLGARGCLAHLAIRTGNPLWQRAPRRTRALERPPLFVYVRRRPQVRTRAGANPTPSGINSGIGSFHLSERGGYEIRTREGVNPTRFPTLRRPVRGRS
jgi:hypothetical protein